MTKNNLETIAAVPVVLRMELAGTEIEIVFRRIVISDRLYNSEKFGGPDALAKKLEELDLNVVAAILFRQLTPESKDSLLEFSNSFVDEDEHGNVVDENLSKYQIFQRLPIFNRIDRLQELIVELSASSGEEESGNKKKAAKKKSSTGPWQSQGLQRKRAGQSRK